MDDLIRDFQTYLQVERNVSGHTRNAYMADLEEFIEFLQRNNLINNQDGIAGIETETIRAYLGRKAIRQEWYEQQRRKSICLIFCQWMRCLNC